MATLGQEGDIGAFGVPSTAPCIHALPSLTGQSITRCHGEHGSDKSAPDIAVSLGAGPSDQVRGSVAAGNTSVLAQDEANRGPLS